MNENPISHSILGSKVRVFSKRLLLLAVFALLACNVQLFAQTQKTISGTVTEESGATLPGVNVSVKGTTNGTITDIDGKFSLTVGENDVLYISFIGYTPQEVPVTGKSNFSFTLVQDVTDLDEVVVTALGIKRDKKSLGYSVTEVGGETMTVNRETNAVNALAGKVAGVQISQPTSGPTGSTRVIIRGISELNGDNQPLYVIDGVPMDNTNFGQADSEGGYDMSSGISDLNPDDIESLSVLKGANAAALYGTRALNGVILITTKKGTSRDGIGVEVNSNYTIDELMTGFEDVQYLYGKGSNGQIPDSKERASIWDNMWGPRFSDNIGAEQVIHDGSLKPYKAYENTTKDFFRTGFSNTNSVNLTGGDDKNTFRLGISNLRNNDIVPGTGLDRTTMTFRGSSQLHEKLNVDAKVTYITDKVKNRPEVSNAGIGANLLFLPNSYDQAWLKNHSDENGEYHKWTGYIGRINPYWTMENVENESRKKRMMGYAQAVYDITDHLTFKVKAGTDFYSNKFYDISGVSNVLEDRPGRMIERNIDVSEENYEGLLSYNNTFGDFSVSANIGANKMKHQFRERHLEGTGLVTEGVKSLDNYKEQRIEPILGRKIINSVYAFGQVGYKNYLFLDLTHRTDWSSTLSKDNQRFSYPSVSTSFVFTDAFKNMPSFFTFGKLRASWAKVGGDTDPFMLYLNYRGSKSFHGNGTAGIDGDLIPKEDLKPEQTTSYEFGTDLRFLNNRVGLDFTYYHKSTVNQILRLPISRTGGYNTAIINAGEIENKGIEVLLNTTPIKKGDFQWDLSFNFTKNINKVIALSDQLDIYEMENARYADAIIGAKEGEALGLIMGAKFERTDDGQLVHGADGMPKVTTGEKHILGNSNPDWMGGVMSDFKYKNLSLRMAFDVRMGGEIYSMTNLRLYELGFSEYTLEGRDAFNEYSQRRRDFQATGPSADEQEAWDDLNPVQGYVGKGVKETFDKDGNFAGYVENDQQVAPNNYWQQYATSPEPFVYDASYIKLRSLALSYTLPMSLIKNTPLQRVTVSAIGTNLFILYKDVPNIDPESTYNSGNGQGLEYGSFPGRRSYGFNVNVRF